MDWIRSNPIFSFEKLKRSDLTGTGIIILLNILILWLLLGNMVFRLNSISFAKGGDGVKGYYSSLYHVKHDPGYHWTTGMNYPFGEHIFFTDSQPLVTNTIKLVSELFPSFGDATVGIINSLMLLSIVFGAALLYLILRKLGLPMVLAIAAATTITWLSPQLGRLGGHFSLSYITHIPGIILLLMLYAEKPTWWRSLWITLWTIFLALTHFYFYGIAAILLLLFWLRAFIRIPHSEFHSLSKTLHLLLQLVVPLILVQGYLLLTDPVTDRPGTPWGFMHYRAYPESVLIPLTMPHGQWITSLFSFNTGYIDWEGHAYAGLPVSLFFTGVFFWLLFLLITLKMKRFLNPFNNRFISMIFWAGTLALLYSFAVPFVFKLEWLLKYLGPIRQMRGVARFAWLFFYIMHIVILNLTWIHLKRKSKLMRNAILSLLLLVVGTEAWFNASYLRSQLDNPMEMKSTSVIIPDHQDYQAIVPLPYFHIGSENIAWEDNAGLLSHVYQVSFRYGIPTTGVMLSRTSIGQTFMQLEPFLEGAALPEILAMYDQRDLLLITGSQVQLSPLQQKLLEGSRTIWSEDHLLIASIPYNTYRKIIGENRTPPLPELDFIHFDDITINDIRHYNRVAETDIPPGTVKGEVWFTVEGITGDLIPRTTGNLVIQNDHSQNVFDSWKPFSHSLTGLAGNNSMHRIPFEVPADGKRLFLSTENRQLKKQSLTIRDIRIYFL